MLCKAGTISSWFLIFSCVSANQGMHLEGVLKRQDQVTPSASPVPSISNVAQTGSSSSGAASTSQSGRLSSSTSLRSGSATGTATRTGATFIDPRLPPGNVVMQTPATTSGSQYYKIGQPVTFGWNYTSLLVSPTAVNIEAYCSQNSQTYTIAHNVSIAKPSVVWDTGSYVPDNNQPPLAMAIYTLFIYNEASAETAAPSAGYLAAFNGFKFGMYTPEPYSPLPEFVCATCDTSDAFNLDLVAFRTTLLISAITCLSFVWFISGI